MFFDREILPKIFSSRDLLRGQEYYKRGQVQKLRVAHTGEGDKITCIVQGSEPYRVSIQVEGQKVSAYCSCPRFADKNICKHIAAAMLACADLRDEVLPADSDRWAKSMLRTYTEKSARQIQQASDRPVQLVPHICPGNGRSDYPSFSFQVGFDWLYVVRDIKKFVESVIRQETVSYGKGLKFCHALEQFSQDAQKLISILADQFTLGRTMEYSSLYPSYETALFVGYQKNQIVLTGSAFDRMFDLFQDKQMEAVSGKQRYTFTARDPETALSLKQRGKAAELRLNVEGGDWTFFGNLQSLYAIGPGQVLRCSRKFQEDIYPLFKSGAEEMLLSFRDLPTFCGCVLPEI